MFDRHSSHTSAVTCIHIYLDASVPSPSRGKWSAWLPQGHFVFVFQWAKHKPLALKHLWHPFFLLSFSSSVSPLSLALCLSPPFLAEVPLWRRQQWPYCVRWELGGRPMMSSCHREDQGERPPGVRNALFFPVVFRKAVINLIPSSSLHAPGVWGKGGR